MPILALGLNHRSATIDFREKVAFPAEGLRRALQSLRAQIPEVSEVVILSTCNRTELHCVLANECAEHVKKWLCENRSVSLDDLNPSIYEYWDASAVQHIMRVACSLDSQVLGEPQISGQFKAAYSSSRIANTIGTELDQLSGNVLRIAKRVRSETAIGRSPVSLAYATTTVAQRIFADVSTTNVLVIGAGDTAYRASRQFKSLGVRSFVVANRTILNAELLASELDGVAIPLYRIASRLHEFDIVIGTTGSSSFHVSKDMFDRACHIRRHRPVFVADLAVPRDVEPGSANLPGMYLYTIDDMTSIIEQGLNSRRSAVDEAEKIVGEGVALYLREKNTTHGNELLKQFRVQIDHIRDEHLSRALKKLKSGNDPVETLERFAHDLTNKLTHRQIVSLRNAYAEQDELLLDYLRSIYELD